MAIPGYRAPPEPSRNKRHYRNNRRSRTTTAMTDQVNFEATRPGSADPAVALAEALGQLPKVPVKAPARIPSPKEKIGLSKLEPKKLEPKKLELKTSVESLAQELGLK